MSAAAGVPDDPGLLGWLTPSAEVGDAPHKGQGVFATAPIEPGELVAVFTGFVTPSQRLADLPDWQLDRCLQIHDDLYLVSTTPSDPPDLINHSCTPNLGFQGSSMLVAIASIAVGDELAFDYAMCDTTPYDEFACECASVDCRIKVTGDDWRDPGLWRRYRGRFSPYVARRVLTEFDVDVS